MRLFMTKDLKKVKEVLDSVVVSLWGDTENENHSGVLQSKQSLSTQHQSKHLKSSNFATKLVRQSDAYCTYHFSDGTRKGTITIIQNRDQSTTLLSTGKNRDLSEIVLTELNSLIGSEKIQWSNFYSKPLDYHVTLSNEQLRVLITSLKKAANVKQPGDHSNDESQYGSYTIKEHIGSRIHTFISPIGDRLVVTERMDESTKALKIDKQQEMNELKPQILQIQGKEALLYKELTRAFKDMGITM